MIRERKRQEKGFVDLDGETPEKERIYAPATRSDGMGWKELKIGLCRVMQDYCGGERNEEGLMLGLKWFTPLLPHHH